jgi:ABC-2 type transport system permease protein
MYSAHPPAVLLFMMLIASQLLPVRLHPGRYGRGFEQLQVVPMLVIMPMTFLGGAFYSIDMLPNSPGGRSRCSTR